MAKISNELMESLYGKLGHFVFRRINGKIVLCKRPVFKKRKLTAKELSIRMRFSFMIEFMKPLMFIIRETYRYTENGKSGFNRAFADNYPAIIIGDHPPFQIDYSRIMLSRGSFWLPKMILAASLLPGTISFIWNRDNYLPNEVNAFIAIYNEDLNEWKFEIKNSEQKARMHTIDLSGYSGKPVHTYFGFISSDGKKASDSLYTGMVNIL